LTRASAQNSEMDSLCGAGVAQLVERVLAKHEVVGSKPITRSIIQSVLLRRRR
jgi:hypothetical protein